MAAYKKLPTSSVYAPTAVLLPCTHFASKGLSAGEVTDFGLRISIFGTADTVAYALALVRSAVKSLCCVRSGRPSPFGRVIGIGSSAILIKRCFVSGSA